MKKLKIVWALVVVSIVILVISSQIQNKKVHKIISGDSRTMISKSNLPVNVRYTTEQVDVNETSNVDVSISTTLSKGTLKVKINDLENDLEGLDDAELLFELSEDSNSFPLNFQVSSEVAGIHYISFIFSVEGKGVKALSIPINIGKEIVQQKVQKAIKNSNGVPLSISHAEEVIE